MTRLKSSTRNPTAWERILNEHQDAVIFRAEPTPPTNWQHGNGKLTAAQAERHAGAGTLLGFIPESIGVVALDIDRPLGAPAKGLDSADQRRAVEAARAEFGPAYLSGQPTRSGGVHVFLRADRQALGDFSKRNRRAWQGYEVDVLYNAAFAYIYDPDRIADAAELSSSPDMAAGPDLLPGDGINDTGQATLGHPGVSVVERVRTASEGDRNNTLFKCAADAARAGAPDAVQDELRVAARGAGLTDREALRTIKSGWTTGKRQRADMGIDFAAATGGAQVQEVARTLPRTPLVPYTDADRTRWLVEGWLPEGELTVLSGRGATGKTTLILQLAAALDAGDPILGLATREAPANTWLYDAENGVGVLRWRWHAMTEDDVIRPAKPPELIARPENAALWTDEPTDFGRQLEAEVIDQRPALLVIDNAARAFLGNEIVRAEVTNFLEWLERIAHRSGSAVLLLAHPGKALAGETADYSGSTAWQAVPRAMWKLRGQTSKEDDLRGDLVLELVKTNLGPQQAMVLLERIQPIGLGRVGAIHPGTVEQRKTDRRKKKAAETAERDRIILHRHADGLTYQQIATEAGCSVGTVHNVLAKRPN